MKILNPGPGLYSIPLPLVFSGGKETISSAVFSSSGIVVGISLGTGGVLGDGTSRSVGGDSVGIGGVSDTVGEVSVGADGASDGFVGTSDGVGGARPVHEVRSASVISPTDNIKRSFEDSLLVFNFDIFTSRLGIFVNRLKVLES